VLRTSSDAGSRRWCRQERTCGCQRGARTSLTTGWGGHDRASRQGTELEVGLDKGLDETEGQLGPFPVLETYFSFL
jgi:hypothetical protein